jgi:hypothetical protein
MIILFNAFWSYFPLFVTIFLPAEKADKKDFHCYRGYGIRFQKKTFIVKQLKNHPTGRLPEKRVGF